MKIWMWCIGLSLALMGCVEEENPTLEVPDSWYGCAEASECALIEVGCCDHCNGGTLVSINATYAEEAKSRLQDGCNEPVACTERACEPKYPTCEAGRCGFDTTPPDACSGLEQAACEASTECRPIMGAPAEETCAGNYDNWMTVYSGCMAADVGCGDAESCAIEPGSGQRRMFPDTCTPAGWAGCSCEVGSTCSEGASTEPGQLCAEDDGDGRVRFTVQPKGCHSSSCTLRHEVSCSVGALNGSALELDALFCLSSDISAQACTADCGGGGTAACFSEVLEAGSYTATLGAIELTFDVPLTATACAGEPFGP